MSVPHPVRFDRRPGVEAAEWYRDETGGFTAGFRGVSEGEAERRAWATVNKESGGGNKSGSGRGKPDNHSASRKGGKKGGAASASRSAAERSASAKKAAATRKRNAEHAAHH